MIFLAETRHGWNTTGKSTNRNTNIAKAPQGCQTENIPAKQEHIFWCCTNRIISIFKYGSFCSPKHTNLCMHACMYVCVYVCMCVCVYVYVYVYVWVSMSMSMSMLCLWYVYDCLCNCLWMPMYVYACICVYMYVYVYIICIYIYIYLLYTTIHVSIYIYTSIVWGREAFLERVDPEIKLCGAKNRLVASCPMYIRGIAKLSEVLHSTFICIERWNLTVPIQHVYLGMGRTHIYNIYIYTIIRPYLGDDHPLNPQIRAIWCYLRMLARGLTISEISFDMDWWNRGILFLSAFHHSRSGESINARCQPWRLLRGYFTCSLKRWSQADTTPGDKNMGCKWLLTHIVAGSLRLNGFWLVLTTSNQFINGIQWVHEAITKQRWFHVSPKMGEGIPSSHDAFHPEVPVGKSSNDRGFLPCLMMSKGRHIPFIITIKMSVKFHKSKIHPIEIQIQFKHYLYPSALRIIFFFSGWGSSRVSSWR